MRTVVIYSLLLLSVFSAYGLAGSSDLALVGAKIYPSPTEPAIENGSILIHGGHIVAVGPRAIVKVPHDATVIDCAGLVVTAGYWNSHVHILIPGLLHADQLSSQQITSQLEAMLTRWGFTTVFDIASVLKNTTLIRTRIESGEVKGPRCSPSVNRSGSRAARRFTSKRSLKPITSTFRRWNRAAQAVERVRQQVRDGADGIKILRIPSSAMKS